MKSKLLLILISIVFVSSKCKKPIQASPNCAFPDIVPFQPYSYPVWHPNGNLLGFNYTPLAGIGKNGSEPCEWYSYFSKPDSTGFYIMNKDGTGFKRITNFNLLAPSWSPDGNWLAFSIGAQIYKMRFTGTGFDTANIVQLTNSGGNFHPSWTVNSDTIYYDSNVLQSGNSAFYTIWKMASDGSGKEKIVDPTGIGDIRHPFIGSNNKIFHYRYISGQPEIFVMNMDGSGVQQVTFNGKNGNRNQPKFFQGSIFYNDNGTLRKISVSDGMDNALVNPSVTYTISSVGKIVYSKMDYSIRIYNNQIGTLWIMNTDGSNNQQLTFNNF